MINISSVRDAIIDVISNIFTDRKVIRGYPIFIQQEELPVIFIAIPSIKYLSRTFGSHAYHLEVKLVFMYSAVNEHYKNDRGYETENKIYEDIQKLSMNLDRLSDFDEESYYLTYSGLTYKINLDREGLTRTLEATIEYILSIKE